MSPREQPARVPRRNGPRLPPEERREQLLDAALVVLAADGLPQLTMEAVAKQAGVAKPVLYAMYPTRAELVAALLTRERERGLEQVSAAMPTQLLSNPEAAYAETIKVFLNAVVANPDRWRLILDAGEGAPPDFREYLAKARADIVERAIGLAHIGLALRGGPIDIDYELVGHTMLGIAELAGRLVISDPTHFTPERLATFVATIASAIPTSFQPPPS
ncbi:TetR family transcriptional regulator [Antrihabitans stalactiti]|uniref:TetR/AcrR family transcriptional regulator n=1 Tax=Antrihabitans stalactiti TaxID=2584121 RepID=A0A848KT90_9NOCA|nr:TetR/AcrR family transcriptional regulator [Antrihabitans stalactiti]